MANDIRKSTGLNNVRETWEKNERENPERRNEPNEDVDEVAAASELDRVTRTEAADYDNSSNEEKLLGGNRASINDDEENG